MPRVVENQENETYRQKRARDYPRVGEQLDAILKGFNQLRLGGANLPADLDDVIGKWLAVKAKHPKPVKTAKRGGKK